MLAIEEAKGMTVREMRQKFIGKRYCIFSGIDRGLIGKCKWIEERELKVENETHKFIWWRIEVEEYQYHWKSYWVTTDQIIRIQDEPDEVPYYSGW